MKTPHQSHATDDDLAFLDDDAPAPLVTPSPPKALVAVPETRPAQAPSTFTFPRPAPELAAGSPEAFPVSALPPVLREVAQDMARVYQTPVCLPGMAALAVLSGALGKSVVVRGGFNDRPTRLNVYVIGSSGRGTGKGVICEQLARPLTKRSEELAARHSEEVARKQGELGLLKKQITQLESKGANMAGADRHAVEEDLSNLHLRRVQLEREASRKRALWSQNTTSEALCTSLLDNDETLFSYSSEAGATLRVLLGKYCDGRGDMDGFLSGYSGDAWRMDRVGRAPVELQSPCMAVLWCVQPSILRELVGNAEAFDRGLTARPFIFDTGAERQFDDGTTRATSTLPAWNDLIDTALDLRLSRKTDEPLVITATPQAREVFRLFYNSTVEMGRGVFADVDGELTRWRENAIKAAGLIAHAEKCVELTADHARRGCELMRWAGMSYLGTLNAGRKERQQADLDRLLGILNAKGGEITLRDLERLHGVDKQTALGVTAAFPHRLEFHRESTGNAGRPREILRHAAAKSAKSDKNPGERDKADNADIAGEGAA